MLMKWTLNDKFLLGYCIAIILMVLFIWGLNTFYPDRNWAPESKITHSKKEQLMCREPGEEIK